MYSGYVYYLVDHLYFKFAPPHKHGEMISTTTLERAVESTA